MAPNTEMKFLRTPPRLFFSLNPIRTLKTLAIPIETHPIPAPKFDPDAHAASIRSLLSASAPDGCRRNLDDLLKPFRHRLDSALVLDVLKGYRELGRSNTLEFFSWAGFQLDFRLEDAVVEYMADFLGRRKLFDDLKWLLKTIARSRGRVSARVVSICIRFLGRDGRVREALQLFDEMSSELNCPPDNMVFNNVLYVLCKRDLSGQYIDAALAIFRRIGQPDTYSYSNVIIGLCRFGRLENAFEVFLEMGKANLPPTRTAANILISQLCMFGCGNGLVEKVNVKDCRKPFDILVPNLQANVGLGPAVEVFKAIMKLGLLPSLHVVNALVMKLCKLQKIEEAIDILKATSSRNPSSSEMNYSIVIKALCAVRRMEEACGMFETMLNQGLKPKLIVYNSMIQAFCKLGKVNEAQNYFDIMNKRRCEPDCATYTMLIHANCKVENWEKAYVLLLEMVGLGWHPHFDTYNLVDGFLKRQGKFDLSKKLERKIDVQEFCAHCKAGRLDVACNKLASMSAKGFYPPVYARDAFEEAFRKAGKLKIAQTLLEETRKSLCLN